jgi:hypothetical protein
LIATSVRDRISDLSLCTDGVDIPDASIAGGPVPVEELYYVNNEKYGLEGPMSTNV